MPGAKSVPAHPRGVLVHFISTGFPRRISAGSPGFADRCRGSFHLGWFHSVWRFRRQQLARAEPTGSISNRFAPQQDLKRRAIWVTPRGHRFNFGSIGFRLPLQADPGRPNLAGGRPLRTLCRHWPPKRRFGRGSTKRTLRGDLPQTVSPCGAPEIPAGATGRSRPVNAKTSAALITDAAPVERILTHIGEQPHPPRITPARQLPGWDDDLGPMPDWNLFGQPEPDVEFDHRIAW